jgi:hypothetical protein
MKLTFTAILALLLLSACQTPPTKAEKRLFDVQTNLVTQVVFQTNTVPVFTNEQRIVTFQTNVVQLTVTNEQYRLTPNDTAKSIEQIGGTVGNLFGVGGIVSTALAGIFGIWARSRSSRNYQTSATLAQNVEDIRAFIKSLPDGMAYDTALTKWMADHQAEAGVTDQVLALLRDEVSNKDAQYAADQVRGTLAALRGTNK